MANPYVKCDGPNYNVKIGLPAGGSATLQPGDSATDSVVTLPNFSMDLAMLMSVAQPIVKAVGTNTPPGSPATGDAYVIGSSPTGAWATKNGQITLWDGAAWKFSGAPKQGWSVYDQTSSTKYEYTGSVWSQNKSIGGVLTVTSDIVSNSGLSYFGSGSQAGEDVRIRGAAASTRGLSLRTGNTLRFGIWIDSGTESGSSAGSNFYIQAADDAGSPIDNPIAINRASGGTITFGGSARPMTFTGICSFNANATFFGPTVATPGSGANLRLRDDTATFRWMVGILGSVAEKDFNIYDQVNSASRLKINNTNGLVTIPGGINLGQQDLKNYSEGTWTPSLQGTTGSAGAYAASTAVGSYVRVGRLVFATFFITLTNKGSWTGNALVAGLPFNANATSAWVNTAPFSELDGVTYSGQLVGQVVPGSASIILVQVASGTNTSNMPFTGFTNTSSVIGTIVYQA